MGCHRDLSICQALMGFQAAFLETGSDLPPELIDTQRCRQSPKEGNLPPLASGIASPLGPTVDIQLNPLSLGKSYE